MAVFSVLPPFLVFPDIDGTPLENGYIYIGQPGFEARSSPKASFFDVANTIPTGTASGAAIRTMGGFAVRNGSPSMFYVDGDFSISVTDRNGALLYSALNTTLAINLGGVIGPILAPDGNTAATGFGFINEVNTGWIRSSAGTVQYIVLGAVVAQMTATGIVFNQPVSGGGFDTGVLAVAQPLDGDLTAIAALTGTGIAVRTAGNTWAQRTITAGAGISIVNGDGVAGNPTISADIGGDSGTIATTSGATVDYNSIPAGVKRLKLHLLGVSCSAGDNLVLRIGPSGGVESTGYIAASAYPGSEGSNTTGYEIRIGSAASVMWGVVELLKVPGIDRWQISGNTMGGTSPVNSAGTKLIAGTLTNTRLLWSGGANFDAGDVIYEWSFI